MREEVLDLLAEPGTGSALRLEDPKGTGGEITDGRLVSEKTGKTYPIVRGIPRFVGSDNYAASFGMQWNEFRRVQLDSSRGIGISRDRFLNETKWSSEDLRGKWCLDAGCGAGRFAEVAAEMGARVVALDFSSAVEAASETLRKYPSATVVQASLLEPPFKPGTFDFGYCIGVVQHTPDPPAVVRNVAEVVKPGGRFAYSIYARQPWTKLNAKYLVRPITRRISKPALLKGIRAIMPVAFPVTNVLFSLPLVGKVTRFAIPMANYVERKDLSREARYEEAVLDTFDMLSPEFDSPMTAGEVERELQRVGVKDIKFINRVPVNVIGVR